jgi:hypothetical protein
MSWGNSSSAFSHLLRSELRHVYLYHFETTCESVCIATEDHGPTQGVRILVTQCFVVGKL